MIEREMNLQGKGELTYEEAVDMVYQFLTTPTSLFKIKEGYDKSRLINSFHLFGGGLNGWSEQIGFVWEKGMTVSHDTAMQVRGLAQLDRLLKDEDKKD